MTISNDTPLGLPHTGITTIGDGIQDGIGDRGMILTGLGTGDPHGGRHGPGDRHGDLAGAGDLHGASGIPARNGRQTYWQVDILPTPETIARLAIEGLTMDQTVHRTTIIDLHTTTEDRA